jgi:ferritin-like metal-binding protein YciE
VMLKNIKSPALDTALISVGRKIEHYEIASYGTLCRWAKDMGYTHEVAVLVSILNQEKLAETLLVELSQGASPLKEVVRRVSQKKIRAAVER